MGVFSCRMDYHGDWRCRLVPCAGKYAFSFALFQRVFPQNQSSVIRGSRFPGGNKPMREIPRKGANHGLQETQDGREICREEGLRRRLPVTNRKGRRDV